eukprot:gene10020-11694_t
MKRMLSLFLCLLAASALKAQDLNKQVKDNSRNKEIMINTCDRKHLVSFPEFKERYDLEYPNYTVNDTVIHSLKPLLSDKKITIVLGTWCGDSKLQVPHFYKVLDAAGFAEKNITLICVDGNKKAENGIIDNLNIERVPTFIVFKDGKESGRIVESPRQKPSWLARLEKEFDQDYMKSLKAFLLEEKQKGHTVYPRGADIFNAFNHTPFDKVKVVILGQDPYHGPGQAHGLSFSVQKGIMVPPSLKNMYKELESDVENFKTPAHGQLTEWADQGVLLLNATLTVRAHEPGSHQGKGWEIFTDKVITELSAHKEGLVFLLWGKYAQNKSILIDPSRHTLFKAAHPSPFSAYNGFFGCKHFSKTNSKLIEQGAAPIDWRISS